MHLNHLKGAAGFPSDDGCYAHSSPVPTLSHPGPPAKPPPAGFPQSPALPAPPRPWPGQAPAQPDQAPSALSRFLNSCPRPTRLARQEAETTLHLARRRRGLGGPGPGHPGKARHLSPPADIPHPSLQQVISPCPQQAHRGLVMGGQVEDQGSVVRPGQTHPEEELEHPAQGGSLGRPALLPAGWTPSHPAFAAAPTPPGRSGWRP